MLFVIDSLSYALLLFAYMMLLFLIQYLPTVDLVT